MINFEVNLLQLLDTLSKRNPNFSEYTADEEKRYYTEANWKNKYGERRGPIVFSYKEWLKQLSLFEFSNSHDKEEFIEHAISRISEIKAGYSSQPNQSTAEALNELDTIKGVEISLVKLRNRLSKKGQNKKSHSFPNTARKMALFLHYLESSGVKSRTTGRNDMLKDCELYGYEKSHIYVYNELSKLRGVNARFPDAKEIQSVLPYLVDYPKALELAQNELEHT